MAHTPVTFHPDQPPGKWQRCGEPPGGDPYYNMSNHTYSGDGMGGTTGTKSSDEVRLLPPTTDSPNADSYHNMPKLIQSGDGVSKNTRTEFSKPVSGALSSADSPPWRRADTFFPNLKCGLHPQPFPPTITAGSTVLFFFWALAAIQLTYNIPYASYASTSKLTIWLMEVISLMTLSGAPSS